MKYITVEVDDGKLIRELPIIFPEYFVHKDVETYFQHLIRREHKIFNAKAVSAGFMPSYDLNPRCHGKSESIGIKSRESEDSRLIQMIDYTHGLVR